MSVFRAHLRRGAVVGATCALLGATTVRADESDVRERSATLFRQGVAAGKAGDFARAEVAFRTSYLLSPSPATLRNWALTEMKLGKMLEALRHLKVAIQAPGLTAEQRAIVQQNLDDAYAATGHLAIKTADGAQVAVDGVLADGVAPFNAPIDVTTGRRMVDARLGSEAAHAEVDALAGMVVDVSMALPEPGHPAPPPQSAVALSDALQDQRSARALATDRESPRPPSWWTTPHTVTVALGTAAAAGVGLGLYAEVASRSSAADADALRSTLTGQCSAEAAPAGCASLRSKIDQVHTDEVLEAVALGAGAACAVGAAIALMTAGARGTARTGATHLAPVIAPGGAGIAGSF
jgi:hypothetical protein